MKLALLVDGMNIYKENPKEATKKKKLLKLQIQCNLYQNFSFSFFFFCRKIPNPKTRKDVQVM